MDFFGASSLNFSDMLASEKQTTFEVKHLLQHVLNIFYSLFKCYEPAAREMYHRNGVLILIF